MANKDKTLLLIVLIMCMVSSAQALDDYTLVQNLTFDAVNIAAFTTSGSTWSITNTGCKSGSCLSYANSGGVAFAYITNSTYNFDSLYNVVVQGWIKDDYDADYSDTGFIYLYDGTKTPIYYKALMADDYITQNKFIIKNGTNTLTSDVNYTTSKGVTVWAFCMLNITLNSSNFGCYADSSKTTTYALKQNLNGYHDLRQGYLGFRSSRTSLWDSIEIYIKSDASTSESGVLSITATDDYTNLPIYTFNATINTTVYSTTNGLININVTAGSTQNFTVFSPSYLNNVTFTNHNETETATATLYQAEAFIIARDQFTGATISTFNVTVGNDYNATTAGQTHHILSAANLTLTAQAAGYAPTYTTIDTTTNKNQTQYVNMSQTLRVTARLSVSNTNISDYSVTITGTPSAHTETKNTTEGYIVFNVMNQTYNISIIATGYAYDSILLETNQTLNYYQFGLFASNTFNISFKNEDTNVLISGTQLNLDLISDTYAANYSTTNGTIVVGLLVPETYTFRYGGAGYQERLSTYTITNNTYQSVTLYLLPADQSTNVTLTVFDQYQNPVQDSTINIYKYNTASNSYQKINTVTTNYYGEAVVDMQINSEFYYFTIYYEDVLKKQTTPSYVTGTSIYFSISTVEDDTAQYFNLYGVEYYLVFNPNTNTFRFFYNDDSNSVSSARLEIYEGAIAGDTFLSDVEQDGAGGTLLYTVEYVEGKTYITKAYLTIDETEYLVKSASWTFGQSITTSNQKYFIVFIMTVVFMFLAPFSLELSFILVPLPTLLGSTGILNLIPIGTGTAIGLMIVGIILAVAINWRRGG